jgi:hypothetical protein
MKHTPSFRPLAALLFMLPALLPAALPAASPPRNNIVLFLIDDLGWRDIGANGSTYYQTPNIDRLAREGVRFTDAYAACAELVARLTAQFDAGWRGAAKKGNP